VGQCGRDGGSHGNLARIKACRSAGVIVSILALLIMRQVVRPARTRRGVHVSKRPSQTHCPANRALDAQPTVKQRRAFHDQALLQTGHDKRQATTSLPTRCYLDGFPAIAGVNQSFFPILTLSKNKFIPRPAKPRVPL
jgi:hypothetical protein